MLNLTPAELISRIFVLIVAFTVHELAHAFVADRFGDDTPRSQGRLTLNPLAHLDPIGSLLLLVAGFGWAKPVQINPYILERRSPWAPMLVALAGPLSNLLMALLAAIPFIFGLLLPSPGGGDGLFPTPNYLLDDFIFLNILLMLFNLLPISPLDGEKVLHFFLPPSGKAFMENLRPYGPLLLMAAIFLLPVVGINLLDIVVFTPASRLWAWLVLGL